VAFEEIAAGDLGERRVMKRMLGILVALAACAIVIAATPGVASAGEGSWGVYGNGAGYCWDDRDWNPSLAPGSGWRILGTNPQLYPADNAPQPAGFFVGPPHQWVGYVMTLERWNGSSWYRYGATALRVQEANTAFYSDAWFDTRTGNWISGMTEFRPSTGGYYRLRYDLYWYGLNWEVLGHVANYGDGMRDDRVSSISSTGWRYVDWCKY
jgi:hypothetical protein